MPASRVPLELPDLGLGSVPVTVSQWLVGRNQRVAAGERLVELLAEGVAIDLPSPVSGRLVQRLAAPDEALSTGQILAWLEADADDDA